MDLNEFYKDHYFFELSRKEQLSSAVNIPAGVITIIAGVIIAIVNTIDAPFTYLEIAELFLLSLATIGLFTSIFFLIRSYFNYGYGYIATSLEVMSYKNDLEKFYKDEEKENKQQVAKEIEDYINYEYVKYTDLNIRNNDIKSSYIHKANWALIITLVFIIFAGIPHVIKTAIDSDQVYKVKNVEK